MIEDSAQIPAQTTIQPGSRRRRISRSARRTIWFYLFISPWLLGFVFLTIIPLAGGLGISMTNYDGLNLGSISYVGLDNYTRIFTDRQGLNAFWRTIIWSLFNVPLSLAVSFSVALLLNQAVRGRGFFRTLFYIPNLIPVVAVAWIFKLFLAANNGPLNSFLSIFRPGTAVIWIGQENGLMTMVSVSLWMGFGFGMVIFLAGLQNVPRELEEASRIDGANILQGFRHVTIPLMTPVIFFQLILTLIWTFQELVRPLLLWPAGGQGIMQTTPSKPAYFVMIHVYRQIFVYSRYGYGTAILWFTFVMLMLFTLLIFWSSRYWVHYEEEIEGA